MAPKEPKFAVDSDLIRKLAETLAETGLSEIEYAEGDRRVRVVRALAAAAPAPAASPAPAATPAPSPGAPAPAGPPQPPAGAITAPMVGTVYLAAEPGATPFVRVGDKIKDGQTLLIIEAMKVMNPIRSPRAGTVTQVLVAEAQPVEYGEPLVVVE